jgi:hypothetical protein
VVAIARNDITGLLRRFQDLQLPRIRAARQLRRLVCTVVCLAQPMEQTTMTSCIDPASRSAPSWSARRAALKSRQVPDDDPRLIECDAALAYWRCRRVIDTERELLDPRHVPALADMLKHAHPVVAR